MVRIHGGLRLALAVDGLDADEGDLAVADIQVDDHSAGLLQLFHGLHSGGQTGDGVDCAVVHGAVDGGVAAGVDDGSVGDADIVERDPVNRAGQSAPIDAVGVVQGQALHSNAIGVVINSAAGNDIVIAAQGVDAVGVDLVHLIEALAVTLVCGDLLAGVVVHEPELADILVGAHAVIAAAGSVQNISGAGGGVAVHQDHIHGVAGVGLVGDHDDLLRSSTGGLDAAAGQNGVDVISLVIHAQELSGVIHIESTARGGEAGVISRDILAQSDVAADVIAAAAIPHFGDVIVEGVETLDLDIVARICSIGRIRNVSVQIAFRIRIGLPNVRYVEIAVLFIQFNVGDGAILQGHGLGVPGEVTGVVAALLAVDTGHVVHVGHVCAGGALHADHIALGGQVDGVVLVKVEAVHRTVHIDVGVVADKLVAAAVQGDGLILPVCRDSAGDGLGHIGIQDLAGRAVRLAEGHGQDGALVIGGGVAPQGVLGLVVVIIIVAVVGVAVQAGEGQDSGGAVAALGGADVGVHLVDPGHGVAADHHGLHVAVVVLIGFHDVAQGHGRIGLDLVVVTVEEVLRVADLAGAVVHVVGAGHDFAHSQVVVLHHIGGVGVLGIGAQVLAVIVPVGGGTAEVIHGILAHQVLEIPLGELHLVVVLNRLTVGVVLHIVTAGGSGDLHVAHDDGVGAVILHHGGLQHVVGIQGGLLTGDGLRAHELVVAVVQADAHGLLDDIDGPVGAGVALDGAVIAQSAQQHLHEGIAAQSPGGPERAVGVAVDDALLRAVGDVARKGVGGGHITEGRGIRAERIRSGGPQDQVADDLGGRAAGQDSVGVERAVGIPVDNADPRDDVDSFLIGDVAVILEVRGARADGDQRQGHHQREHQRKELLHWDFSSFKKFAVRRKTPGGSGIRVGASQPTGVGLHQPQSRTRGASAVRKANLREKTAGVQRFANLLIQLKNGAQTAWTAMSFHHNTKAISAPAAVRAQKESGP